MLKDKFHLCPYLSLQRILKVKKIVELTIFFCGGRGLNHGPCIYYALVINIEVFIEYI